MMTADDVIEVLDRFETAGVSAWLDGGWGVDALLGRQTRSHEDLDVAIDRRDLERAQEALGPLGFRHAADAQPGLPARYVMQDAIGRQIDIHSLAFDEAGNGLQDLGNGAFGRYPSEGLVGSGKIMERPVRCLTPELQLRFHQGYQPNERDHHDMRLLAESFHLTLPGPYESHA